MGYGKRFDATLVVKLLAEQNKTEVDFMDLPFIKSCAEQMGCGQAIHVLSKRKFLLDGLSRSDLFCCDVRLYRINGQEFYGRSFVFKSHP